MPHVPVSTGKEERPDGYSGSAYCGNGNTVGRGLVGLNQAGSEKKNENGTARGHHYLAVLVYYLGYLYTTWFTRLPFFFYTLLYTCVMDEIAIML